MIGREDAGRVARFFDQNLETLLDLSLQEVSSPVRRDLISRLLALIVDRFCLEDQALFWEDFSRTPYGATAALDGLDSLEHAAARLLRDGRGAAPGAEAAAVSGAIEAAIDEIRSGFIRLTQTRDGSRLLGSAQPAGSAGGDQIGANILENIGSGVLFADARGRISFANSFAKDLLGPKATGASISELLPGLEVGASSEQRRLSVRLGGKDTVLGYRCVPCVLDGTRGTVVSFRDIGEIIRMRTDMEQMRRLSEIGRMCAIVAHEIRNPLAGILATIQSIEPEAQKAGMKEPLEVIEREVRRLAALLTDFFGLVRQAPPRRRATDLSPLVERAVRGAGARLRGLSLDADLGGVGELWLDPDQILQVLLNLLINAADASKPGGKIKITARVEAGRLVLRVEDEGSGIAPDDLDRVFDAFFTTKPGGTGLGLSICFRIVAAHGGTIGLESAPGRGTRVNVEIPLVGPTQDAS